MAAIPVLVVVGLLSLAFFLKPRVQVIGEFTDSDVEALARMLASEHPREADFVQVALAWTAKNMADRRGLTVFKLLAPDGKFGSQSGRYASTVNPANDRFRAIARSVLDGSVADPTPGAIQFDAPDTQDWLYEHGKVRLDAAGVAASRTSEGRRLFELPGISPDTLRFWV